MTTLLELGCLFVLGGLPAALSTVGMLWYRYGRSPDRGRTLELSAGSWLAAQVVERRLDLRLEVHGAPGLDAYWPGVDAIGLSAATWHGRRPTDLAIAAHELGHALNVRSHPLAASGLPIARLARSLSWRAFVATVVAALLMGTGALVPVASGLLVLSLGVTVVVCLDELFASQWAARLLREDPRIGTRDLATARRSMRAAGSLYALDLLGHAIVLAAWPAVVTADPFGHGLVAGPPSAVAVGLAVVLLPILLLRAAQVSLQVWDPEPVTTDFRLFTVMHRESRWEFLSGIAVLTVVALLHPLLTGPLAVSALVGAIMT
ncbi:MAG: zinc metallopeptidase, partial [Myxococcota bacterium]